MKTFSGSYPYGLGTLSQILIPSAGALVFLKLVSYSQRSPERIDKRNQDLNDVVDMMNHRSYDERHVVACLYSSKLQDVLRDALSSDENALEILRRSNRWKGLEAILHMGGHVEILGLPSDVKAQRVSRSVIPRGPSKDTVTQTGMTQIASEMIEISTKARQPYSERPERDVLIVIDIQNDFFSEDALPAGLHRPALSAKKTGFLFHR